MARRKVMKRLVLVISVATLFFLQHDLLAETVKPEKINIGVPIDLTGPYSTILANYAMGYKDVVAWINENGGVKGVPLNLLITDTGSKMPRAISAFEQMLNEQPRPVCFSHQQSTEQKALKDRYFAEKMANISNSGAYGVLSPPSSQFSNMGAGYAAAFCRFLEWWKQTVWAKKGMNRQPKMALITWDNEFGKAPITDESVAYMKDVIGIDHVGTWYIPFFPTDTTSQLLSAKNAGADIIMGWYHMGAFSVLLKDAVKLGIKDKIEFANVITGAEYLLPNLAGKEASEGVYSVSIHPFWDETNVEGIRVLNEIFQKNHRDPNKDKLFGYTTSLHIFLLIKEVCEAVVDQYGWEGLNSENFMKVLSSGREFDVMGLTPPVKYVGDCRVLAYNVIGKITDGKLKRASDWLAAPNLWPKEWGWKLSYTLK